MDGAEKDKKRQGRTEESGPFSGRLTPADPKGAGRPVYRIPVAALAAFLDWRFLRSFLYSVVLCIFKASAARS